MQGETDIEFCYERFLCARLEEKQAQMYIQSFPSTSAHANLSFMMLLDEVMPYM